MPAARPTIVFDLDGTLVHTAHDLVGTLNYVLAQEAMDPIAIDDALAMVGNGARVMLETAYSASGRKLTAPEMDERVAVFLAYYDDHLADQSAAYPGATDALARFEEEGWLLAVCTNKFEKPARKLLDIVGLAPRFSAITGQDTFPFRKPDPRHLTETIRLAGGDPANAIMVGDSRTDVDTATAAGIPVVGVDFGYTTIPMSELGATRVISRLDALYDAVADIRR